MTLDPSSIVQAVIVFALTGLVADHFRLRSEVAKLQAQFVPWEHMRRFEEKIDRHHEEARADLQRLAEGLAELKGRTGG